MTPEQLEAARERAAHMRKVREANVEALRAERESLRQSVRLTPRTFGRLDCLLEAPDFNFIDYDDLIAWMLRQVAITNRTASFHLNMRYQREREEGTQAM